MKVSCLCTLRAHADFCLPMCLALTICLFACAAAASSQTLFPNSGMNPRDTNPVFDLSVPRLGTVTLPNAIYNPVTQTTSASLSVSPLATTMHVEIGYDSTSNPAMNLYLAPPAADPTKLSVRPAAVARFSKGQITLFDRNNAHIPMVLPNSSTNGMGPLALLGANPGASIASQLQVNNIQSFAAGLNAPLAVQGNTATITMPSSAGVQVVWTYLQSGSTWTAQQVQISSTSPTITGTRTFQFSNLAVFDNAGANAARAARPSTLAPPQASNSNAVPQVTPATSSSCDSSAQQFYQLGGVQNIAFRHGILSSPCTWTRMKNWLNGDFVFGNELIANTAAPLNTGSPLVDQGQDFYNQVVNARGSNYIFVGHSEGGLISRWAAQQFQSTATPVRGVITMDTPNQGADIGLTGPAGLGAGLEWLSNFLYGQIGCESAYDNYGCFFASVSSAGGSQILAFGALDSVGAVRDLTPNSQFLQDLNSKASQESFQQAGIIGYSPQQWLVARIGDNFLTGITGLSDSCYPEVMCGEDGAVVYTEYFFDEVEADLVLNLFLALESQYEYCDDSYDCPGFANYMYSTEQKIATDYTVLELMEGINLLYDVGVAPDLSGSDGIVQASSQFYPSPNAQQYPIQPSHSHTGVTRSQYDHATMDQILVQQFNVQTTANCAYAVSQSLFSLSANGGTESFVLTTSQGCPWSVASQGPWLILNSAATGMSTATVSFTAQPNPLNIARQASINIVGSASTTNTASVEVTETGVCTYTLTPGPQISVPGTGGTGSIAVNTQAGCAWSAVSSQISWLTITGSATGTGSGSFQYTAADNTTASDRTATIAVADQTLTVVQGTASGAPGTGTVTITGSPQSAQVNQCPGNPHGPCMATIQEGGAVTVWVNGQSYSAQYPPNESAASLAWALATQMNATSSLIFATVPGNGNTIIITANVNGAATNYPLSTSFGFNTSNFSSPAFQATASGPSLTGGVD